MAASSTFHEFVHDSTFSDLPRHVASFSQRCVLDLIGVAAGAIDTPLSATIRDHAANHFGAGATAATMLFDGRVVSPAGAALAGGMTIDALDAHDGHRLTKGHAGCGVFPATLAMSQAAEVSDGREFLAAMVVGYEVGTRAGIALHETTTDYHTSGAWGAVACAAVGARLLGLDDEATRHAIGIAEYHGPRSQMMRCIDHPTMLKDGSGWGAMAGVSAAYLAHAGFTGAPAITVEATDVADLWADLGHRWYILEQYFKPHPVCRWAQPAVEAALALRAAHGFCGDDVADITIHTFHEAVRLGTAHPSTTEEAQYSLAFPTAAALVSGELGPRQVGLEALADPSILGLCDRTKLVENEAYNTAFPHRRYAHVAIQLDNGEVLTSERTEARGDPEAHLDDAEIAAKFDAYASPVVGQARASAISEAVSSLNAGANFGEFCRTVTEPVLEPRE